MASSWLSADRLLILGVAGFGAFAVYRMLRSDAGSGQSGPTTPEGPNALLPMAPGPIGPPPTDIALLTGSPIRLTNSRAYRGRLETIDAQGRPLPSRSLELRPAASREELTRLVESFGFEPGTVRVSMTTEEAAANGVPPFVLQNAGQGTRWFYGRYLGPTQDVPRPEGVTTLWIVRGPALPMPVFLVPAFPTVYAG